MDNKAWRALEMVSEYVELMKIDWFAFPEQTSKGVNVVLVHAHDFVSAIEGNIEHDNMPRMLKIEKGEEFFRVRKEYSANKMWAGFERVSKIRIATDYKKVADIPKHCNMIARGFEKVVAQAINGNHTGDDVKSIDVISAIHGNIECKIGGGRLYTATSK